MDIATELSADTAALVAAKLTECVVLLEQADDTTSLDWRLAQVEGVFTRMLSVVTGAGGTGASLSAMLAG